MLPGPSIYVGSRFYVIGLDIGTSSVKAVGFDRAGQCLCRYSVPLRLQSPAPDRQELRPDIICRAVRSVVRRTVELMGGPPAGLAFSSAMHSILAVDGAGRPLTPLIVWADTRAAGIAESLFGSEFARQVHLRCGTPMHAMLPLVKIPWIRRETQEVRGGVHRYLDIKSYLIQRFCGVPILDTSLASATGMFDMQTLDWFGPSLAFAGIRAEQLPVLVSPHDRLPLLDAAQARSMGLPRDVPFFVGAADGCLSNLGAGAWPDSGRAVLTIGTSAALRISSRTPDILPDLPLFRYRLFDDWTVIGGGSNSGGAIYEWFTRTFLGKGPGHRSVAAAQERLPLLSPGSDGLLFLPYLMGERAPVWDARARGCFQGIGMHHTRDHFHRAVLEGLCLNLRQIGEALEKAGHPFDLVLADGGFTNQPVWMQIAADIFGKPVRRSVVTDSAARGAAALAMQGLGLGTESWSNAAEDVSRTSVFWPDRASAAAYQESSERFAQLFSRLRSVPDSTPTQSGTDKTNKY